MSGLLWRLEQDLKMQGRKLLSALCSSVEGRQGWMRNQLQYEGDKT